MLFLNFIYYFQNGVIVNKELNSLREVKTQSDDEKRQENQSTALRFTDGVTLDDSVYNYSYFPVFPIETDISQDGKYHLFPTYFPVWEIPVRNTGADFNQLGLKMTFDALK